MADEYVVPIQTGSSFAADDVAGKKVQRLKLAQGLDGVADDVTAANPLPGDVGRVRTNAPAASSSDVLLVQPIGATGTILTPTTSTEAPRPTGVASTRDCSSRPGTGPRSAKIGARTARRSWPVVSTGRP